MLWKLETLYDSGVGCPIRAFTSVGVKDLKEAIKLARSKNKGTGIVDKTLPIDPWLIEAAFSKIERTSGGRIKKIIKLKIAPGGSNANRNT